MHHWTTAHALNLMLFASLPVDWHGRLPQVLLFLLQYDVIASLLPKVYILLLAAFKFIQARHTDRIISASLVSETFITKIGKCSSQTLL